MRAVGGARWPLPAVDPDTLALLTPDPRHDPQVSLTKLSNILRQPRELCRAIPLKKRIALRLARLDLSGLGPLTLPPASGKRGRPSTRTEIDKLVDEIAADLSSYHREVRLRQQRVGARRQNSPVVAALPTILVIVESMLKSGQKVVAAEVHRRLCRQRAAGTYRGPVPDASKVRVLIAEWRAGGITRE